MTEQEWLTSDDPAAMLGHLTDPVGGVAWLTGGDLEKPSWHPSDRKLRLFACACVRQLWRLLQPASRRCVESGEALAETATASQDAEVAWIAHNHDGSADVAARVLCRADYHAADVATNVLGHLGWLGAEVPQVAALLREVIGNPFRFRAFIDPGAAPWVSVESAATTRQMALDAYEANDWGLLPLIADALEYERFGDEEVLSHLRSPGVHVRGCWALDLLLGKS